MAETPNIKLGEIKLKDIRFRVTHSVYNWGRESKPVKLSSIKTDLYVLGGLQIIGQERNAHSKYIGSTQDTRHVHIPKE